MASRLGVAGFAGNDERGVVIEAEGSGATLAALLAEIRDHPPPLALVTAISAARVPRRPAFHHRGQHGPRPGQHPDLGRSPRPARTACGSCVTRRTPVPRLRIGADPARGRRPGTGARLRRRAEEHVLLLRGGEAFLECVRAGLRAGRAAVLVHSRLPGNDGGISLGQVAVAAAIASQLQ